MDRLYFYRGVKVGSFCVIRKGKQKKTAQIFRPAPASSPNAPHAYAIAPPLAASGAGNSPATCTERLPPHRCRAATTPQNTRHIHLEYQTFTPPVFEAGCERARCPFRSCSPPAPDVSGKGSPQTCSPRRAGSPNFPHASAPLPGRHLRRILTPKLQTHWNNKVFSVLLPHQSRRHFSRYKET